MSLLLSLPDELLVMILNLCSSSDHVNISQVCEKLREISCDRKVVRVVNFHHQTRIHQDDIKRFVTYRPRAANIITIDLTSCYWLTSSFLQNLVSKLSNLENLLVADTALLPQHLKQLLQTLLRIKRLSWTWHKAMQPDGFEDVLKRLEFLYLCIPESKYLNNVVKFVNKCVELRELWINNIDGSSYMRNDKHIELQHLERIILHPCKSWPTILTRAKLKQNWRSVPSIAKLENDQLLTIESLYAYRWHEVCHVINLGSKNIEKICSPDPIGPNSETILSRVEQLKALHIVLPKGVVPVNLLSNCLNLNELGISVASKEQECSTRYCEMAAACPKLKLLSLPVQALVCTSSDVSSASGSSNKRISRVRENVCLDEDSPFRKMVHSTPLVEVFEIGVTGENSILPTKPHHLRWDSLSLSFINEWKYLTALTLANLPIITGKFFTPILRDCKLLESLKIVDLGHEAACNYSQDLYNALPLCNKLQDFHWTQSYVGSTSKLWKSLQQISTLQRIALCLQGLSELEEVEVFETMEKCNSLFFLHLATCTTKVKSKLIKKTLLSRWSEIRPHLYVWLGLPGEILDAVESCPAVHVGEMFQEDSRIIGVPTLGGRFLSIGRRDWAPHM